MTDTAIATPRTAANRGLETSRGPGSLPGRLHQFARTSTQAKACGSLWDRLWRHRPPPRIDDARLQRESDSPRWKYVTAAVRSVFGSCEGLRTIELGSGRGDFSALMAAQGAKPTLVDFSRVALDQARERFDRLKLAAEFVCGDMFGDLDGLRGQYDVSMSLGLIEHFRGRDRTSALRRHYDVLRPGGITLISVPNATCPTYRVWKLYLEARGWWPYGMEIPYSRVELRRRAARAGFRDVRVVGTGFWFSVGEHLCGGLLGRRRDWTVEASRWDERFGANLMLIARSVGPGRAQRDLPELKRSACPRAAAVNGVPN